MEVELVGKEYVAEALHLSLNSLASYITKKRRDLLPPNGEKIKGHWLWPKADVDAFASTKQVNKHVVATLPRVDDFGTDIINGDEEFLLNIEQCAAYLGFTVKSVKWRATNRNAPRPLPSVLIKAGKGKAKRYFYKADLDTWRQSAPRSKDRNWPPSQRLLLASTSPPVPSPNDFPDNGEPIESYRNLAGRLVQPAWLDCLCGCGQRFLSPDRTHQRFADNCKVKLNAA